jgi:clarin
MSLKTRSLVFATFFGSCCVIGLLIASLTTDYWITAQAKRQNTTASEGKINFGLFTGIVRISNKHKMILLET